MSSSAAGGSQAALARGRSPLERLLHALNQPLTGLQCSMEVALASPRTPEQYVRGLREGLALTERMRALVEAIREVVEEGTEEKEAPELIAWTILLREVVDELKPVAEAKGIRITLEAAADFSAALRMGRRGLSGLLFRLLESAVSLADRGSALWIETGGTREVSAEDWIQIRWYVRSAADFSRSELGLLVAQAGWERAGAKWERLRTENLETVTIRLPGIASGGGNC